jgi:iron complex transport system ATP-binding protein
MEVLGLARQLHREGRTVVAVLHDLALAARFATHVNASGASGPSAPAGRVTTTTENQEMLP